MLGYRVFIAVDAVASTSDEARYPNTSRDEGESPVRRGSGDGRRARDARIFVPYDLGVGVVGQETPKLYAYADMVCI